MAESLAHRWGQIIGDVFEQFVRDMLKSIAEKPGLYLDYKKPRRARAKQGGKDLSKVTWQDSYGNRHDLDYVLERGGTEDTLGFQWRSSNQRGADTPNTRKTRFRKSRRRYCLLL